MAGLKLLNETSAAWVQALGSLAAIWVVVTMAQREEARLHQTVVADHNALIECYLQLIRMATFDPSEVIKNPGPYTVIWQTCRRSAERMQAIITKDPWVVIWSSRFLDTLETLRPDIRDGKTDQDYIKFIENTNDILEQQADGLRSQLT